MTYIIIPICIIFGEPYWIRTNDTFLKSKLHNKNIPVNGSFIARLFRYLRTKCYNLLRLSHRNYVKRMY